MSILIRFFLILVFPFILNATINSEYNPFILKQLKLLTLSQDSNISSEILSKIAKEQDNTYLKYFEYAISHKSSFIKKDNLYDSEIFRLKKIIDINKRAGNSYAVLRDEAKVNSYTLLHNQNLMIIEVLKSLDYTKTENFHNKLNKIVIENQEMDKDLLNLNYKQYLDLKVQSKILDIAKTNIIEFNKLLDINIDTINHLYTFEDKIYRLNQYANYNLLGVDLFVNDFKIVKFINPILDIYGLSVFKIILMLVIFIFILFIRKVVYVYLKMYLLKAKKLKDYAEAILSKISKPLEMIVILINIDLTIYIYNDFTTNGLVVKFFNISYSILIIWLIYRVINVVATIKINNIDRANIRTKNGIINVGIKILNFAILIIGILVVLKLAGVDLTAVLSGLGIGGIAVALASKDSLSNFFGTISVLLSDVFSQGDWIVVDGKEGVVVEIGLRVTTLRTFDNALIAVPNAVLANNEVKNWNKRKLGRRIKMSLGLKYDSNHKDIKKAIDEIRDMLDKHKGIATQNTTYEYTKARSAKLVSKDDAEGVKKTLLVYLDQFSDSSINILVYCFSKSVDWEDWLRTKEDVMYKIMEIFERNSLEFAFPSLSIYKEN